jgi:hypothetical protein
VSAPLTVWHTRANTIGNAAQLEHYWTKTPEGLAKWASAPHPFDTLVAHLAKYVKSPDGLAATYYRIVFGVWPEGVKPAKPKRKRKGRRT